VHIDSWRTTYKGIVTKEYLEGLSYSDREAWWFERLHLSKYIFVAENELGQVGKSIIGFCAGRTNRSAMDSAYEAELGSMYILEEYRGRGVGRVLFVSLVRAFIENRSKSMIVWVLAKNPYRRFYESLGGLYIRSQEIQIGGSSFEEVAYGWTDLKGLLEALVNQEGRIGGM